MSILDVKDLKAHYITDLYGIRRRVQAVDGVSLSIKENEIFGIAGESGCGKTTLIKALTGLVQPPLTIVRGKVEYQFQNERYNMVSLQEEKQRRRIRGAYVSYIPQGSMSVLNPVQRIRKSFRDFVGAHRDLGSRSEFRSFVSRHLNDLGLSPEILRAYPHQLSGGMRQRVTIALATILKPQIILADEPSTALDVVMQRGVIQLLNRIRKEMRNTIVLVTHDIAIHANICDRIAIMYAGQIVEEGPINEVFGRPVHPYTRFLLSSLPSIGDKTDRKSAPGSPPSLTEPPPGCRFHPRCPEGDERCRFDVPPLVDIGNEHRVACFVEESPE